MSELPKLENEALELRVIEVVVLQKGKTTADISATFVRIEDDGAGEYLKVHQDNTGVQPGEVAFNVNEWSSIKTAIDFMAPNVRSK